MTNPYLADSNWPTEYNACRVQGKFINLLGQPMAGTISFTAQTDVMIAQASHVVIVPTTIQVTLDDNGQIDFFLPATDDPDIAPYGFYYSVTENWPGGRTYLIEAPYAGIENLADLTTPVAPGQSIPDAGFAWQMVHGEYRSWSISVNTADGDPVNGVLSFPSSEWRAGIRSTDPLIAKFGTSSPGAVATGTISVTGNVITLTLPNTESVNISVGKYYFDVWCQINGQPFRVTPGTIRVTPRTTAP